ncbi:phosphatidylglycerophosphatase A [Legionella londiniensis]|uniref:Phosphatidylglycerophosphatase A n=2 Tax=Legionella londiniensis TaxID=45068 RepID=A0A0W0VP58_9GAMM|nr:phosphatidylglycerophosphatase A [Legionella londiniensis]STX92649.1 phosphatidylglycerophosphatase A [Legionella londiniensis]
MKLSERVWQDPAYFIAFGFGSGLAPIAPGTFGTLAAFPLYLLLSGTSWITYLLCTVFAFILGIAVSNRVSSDLGVHDYSGIVWDEVVGYLCTMFLAPPGFGWMVLGFFLFRVFDIWKPEPIHMIDKQIGGGFGIMLDDVLAAVPAWFILQLAAFFCGRWA